MPPTREQLEEAIAALQAQRAVLGDAVAELAIAPLRAQLAQLDAAQAAAPVQQLKLVSVLFLDVVGSTALASRLDPEDIQSLLDGLLAALTAVVDQHGGRVLQYAGDSLLAAFGVDEVHEDDAERAVLCGLALLRTARHRAEAAARERGAAAAGAQLDVRIGIGSGSVVIGGGVDGDRSIRGITVNLAARMEQTAPPGALRISQDTWRLVRGRFDAEAQPPLTVKGRDEPLATWLVRGVLASPAAGARRGVDGVHVPMLGRDAELALLQAAYRAAAAGGSGLQTLLVVADAGIGKTRLVDDFAGWAAAQPAGLRRVQAAAIERHRGRPYGALRGLLLAALGLADTGLDAEAWHAATAARLPDRASAALLGHLIGIDGSAEPAVQALRSDARALRDRAFFHALQLLAEPAAAAAPLVIVLDDAHWADDASLDFVEHLQRQAADWPALLLVATRPLLFERRAAWAAAAWRRIDLAALDGATCIALVRALLQQLPEVPPALLQWLAGGADGNPFFIEELVNMLVDDGAVDLQRGSYVPERLQALALPGTLVGVLQARLALLPPDRRHPLRLAAVAGAEFRRAALALLDTSAPAALPDLQARELLVRRAQAAAQPGAEHEAWAFRHHTLHRVTYDSVLKRVRRAAHAALARWMATLPDAPALQDQIAEHHERADEPLLARDAWHAAAEAALQRFANADALAHAARALALSAAEDLQRRLELTRLTLRVLETLADRPRLAAAVDAFEALAEASADAGWRSDAAQWRARLLYAGGDAAGALAAAQRAAALAPADDPRRGAHALARVFFALTRLARWDEARAAAEAALALARAAGNVQIEGSVLNQLGSLAFEHGDLAAAAAHWQQALALHRRIGHLGNEAGTLSNLAFAAMSVGEYAAATAQFEAARGLCEKVGQQQNHGIVCINLGIAALHLHEPQQALAHAERALDLLRLPGDRWAQGAALRVAGQALLALGRAEEARQRFVESRDALDAIGQPHVALEAIAALSAEALARGDVAAALVHAEAILQRQAQGTGLAGTDEPMRIPLAVWRALHAAGDPRAPGVLAAAQRELHERAARLVDPAQRRSYLQAVHFHREIVDAVFSPGS